MLDTIIVGSLCGIMFVLGKLYERKLRRKEADRKAEQNAFELYFKQKTHGKREDAGALYE